MSKQVTDEKVQEELELEINGRRMTRAEIENSLKFADANDRRAQQLADERRQLQADREAAERRLAEREQTLTRTLDTLVERVAPPRKEDAPPSLHDQVRPILEQLPKDYVSDAEAPQKVERVIAGLLENIERAQAGNNQALEQKYQQQLATAKAELAAELAKERTQNEVKLTRHSAVGEAHQRNERVIQEALTTSELAGLKLTPQEAQAIKKKALEYYVTGAGEWDATAGVWLPSAEGVVEAAWTIPSVRDKIRAADQAAARGDGLRARVRGEEASRSTPNRSRPALGGEVASDDAEFIAKVQYLEAVLQQNPHAAEQVKAQMSQADWDRLDAMKANTRARTAEMLRSD